MKIVLVTDYFYPLSNGGTEKYVYLLAKHLTQQNQVRILSINYQLKQNSFEGLNIDYLLPNSDNNKAVIKGIKAPNNIVSFKEYLEEQKPDIVHFHTLTTNFNHYHIQVSYNFGIKTFFTSHIPGHQCLRGDFMYHGKKSCDGKIEKNKCNACLCFSKKQPLFKGVIKFLHYTISKNNPASLKLKHLKILESNTDKIISVCNWQKEYFLKNGIQEDNLAICRQEVSSKKILKNKSHKIRLGFIGRIDPVKGLELLLNSLRHIDNIELNIAAISPPLEHELYLKKLLNISTINYKWKFNLSNEQIEDFFKQIDYLIIPSQIYETGPFVAYEALAFNTPIIATNIGGQKELVLEGENGYLFEPNETALIKVLQKIIKLPILKIEHIKYKEENIAKRMRKIYNN